MNDGYPVPQPYSRAGLLAKLTGAAALAAGALLYGNATSQLQTLALGSTGRVMVSGASAPAWSDSGLSYASGVLAVAGSAPGTASAGQVLVGGGAVKAGATLSAATSVAIGNKTVLPGALNSAAVLRSNSTASYWGFETSAAATLGYSGFAAVSDFKVLDAAAADIFRASTAGIVATYSVTVPNGTAAAPGIKTSEGHGFYRHGASALGFSVAGAAAGILQTSTGGTYRTALQVNTSDSVQPAWICHGQNTDSLYVGGSAAGGLVGGQLRVYGSAHASKADYVELTHGSTVKLSINATGIGFFGVAPVARPSLAAASGTATRTTFDTATVTTTQLAERVKALIDDWRGYGLAA